MFELSVALKYLIPRKKQLSVSLIATLSVAVISLVVWLVLLFLSVTEGIEKNWLQKLTSFNAPLRINPTNAYLNSYYYKVDAFSSASSYEHKTLAQKAASLRTDPYSPESDPELPAYLAPKQLGPDGAPVDPVKTAYKILQQIPGVVFQDYELSGAMMKLQLSRPESGLITQRGGDVQTHLTQASYLSSFSDRSPYLLSLLSPLKTKDLNHLFYLSNASPKKLQSLLENIQLEEVKTTLNHWRLPANLLPEGVRFSAQAFEKNGSITHCVLDEKPVKGHGSLIKQSGALKFVDAQGERIVDANAPLLTERGLTFRAVPNSASIQNAKNLTDVLLKVQGTLQGISIQGEIHWDGLEIAKAEPKTHFAKTPNTPPLWAYSVDKKGVLPANGVLLAKSFESAGVCVGDQGYLAYSAPTISSIQEQRLPIFVAGFYDPGIMAIGNKCILLPGDIAHAVNASSQSYTFDPSLSNGIQVWFQNLDDVNAIKKQIVEAFDKAGIGEYWQVTSFKEYDFAKDLMEQFQSDKLLFMLVGIIILVVACSNIISLLVLLVNDKKKEIGIMQSMGASNFSIAAIFGVCGIAMGILSAALGAFAAYLTLQNIDTVVGFLSFLQGHEAFNAAFYGKNLPTTLSSSALTFILIVTPLMALVAGLVPAIKACRLRPSNILRSE